MSESGSILLHQGDSSNSQEHWIAPEAYGSASTKGRPRIKQEPILGRDRRDRFGSEGRSLEYQSLDRREYVLSANELIAELVNMLSRLAPESASTKDSLRTLLEDERIHGTRERDANAPRSDYHYFKPGVKYVLIEDATSKHRTVMVKEYGFTQKEEPEWPILHERFLRPSAANQSTVELSKIRARAWSLYVECKPFEGEAPSVSDLKRSTSLRSLPCTPKLPDALPYQDASGNSVVLTSNIASTSTANNSPALFGQNAMGVYKDRAIMQMNKRVQVLKGNARLAAAKRSSVTDASIAELTQRRASTGSAQPCIPPKTFLTHWQLCRMLDQAREPVARSDITAEMRMKNREKVDAGLKGREQETAAGYCENCRLRYNDLSVVSSARSKSNGLTSSTFLPESTLNSPGIATISPASICSFRRYTVRQIALLRLTHFHSVKSITRRTPIVSCASTVLVNKKHLRKIRTSTMILATPLLNMMKRQTSWMDRKAHRYELQFVDDLISACR